MANSTLVKPEWPEYAITSLRQFYRDYGARSAVYLYAVAYARFLTGQDVVMPAAPAHAGMASNIRRSLAAARDRWDSAHEDLAYPAKVTGAGGPQADALHGQPPAETGAPNPDPAVCMCGHYPLADNGPAVVNLTLTDAQITNLLQDMAQRIRASLDETSEPADMADRDGWLARQRVALHQRERANLLEIAAHYVRRAHDAAAD